MIRQRVSFAPLLMGIILCASIAGLLVHGCASNPVSAAQDPSQRAYAIYGEFVLIEEIGAKLVRDPTVPASWKIAIRRADAKAKPTADALAQAWNDYQSASNTLKQSASDGTAADLAAVTANLTQWITQAERDVSALATAVKTSP